ncbi:MAG: tRNA-dihydrouridine synthase [Actinobacteria bacterium]|nr:tRNA-dihydrouridine synthase [Actinomycetota bacterium]
MTHTTSHINEPFSVGSVQLPNRLVQAPMAGISGRAFRLQARRFGAGLLTTEMVSSHGIHFHNRRTQAMLELLDEEHPVALQLFGNDPAVMAEAARAAEAAGADIIDINMGCPVRKVVKTGAGVALMGEEMLASRITATVSDAVSIPVTVKIRSGLKHEVTAPEFARRMEAAGAAAICIHPRLAVQGQKGWADHAVTRELASSLRVPVIASGDISRPGQALDLVGKGCAAVMIGRASLGNPWIFEDLLAGQEPSRRPSGEVLAELSRFYLDVLAEMGEERAHRFMRKFYGWFLKPFRPDARLRDGLRRAASFDEAELLIRGFLAQRPRCS